MCLEGERVLFISIYLPSELNLVKNVGDLKFRRGAMMRAKNIGTVLFRSHILEASDTSDVDLLVYE